MAFADLQSPVFTDETAARAALEAVRWPFGPVCPHCGSPEKIGKVEGKSQERGLYYCGSCKGQFTVKVGTVFERSKIPLTKWWLASHLLSSSKKGMSAHQLGRMLGLTYKSAWFMAHRIREAMRELHTDPIGGANKVVEIDETYFLHTKSLLNYLEDAYSLKSGQTSLPIFAKPQTRPLPILHTGRSRHAPRPLPEDRGHPPRAPRPKGTTTPPRSKS